MVVNLSEAEGRFCVVWLEKYKLFYLSVSCNTSIKVCKGSLHMYMCEHNEHKCFNSEL
jgi:hypothetical protein